MERVRTLASPKRISTALRDGIRLDREGQTVCMPRTMRVSKPLAQSTPLYTPVAPLMGKSMLMPAPVLFIRREDRRKGRGERR